jgi:hypothetical protein
VKALHRLGHREEGGKGEHDHSEKGQPLLHSSFTAKSSETGLSRVAAESTPTQISMRQPRTFRLCDRLQSEEYDPRRYGVGDAGADPDRNARELGNYFAPAGR